MNAALMILLLLGPDPAQKRTASEHFNKGQKLYAAERYEDALAEFKAGYAAFPLPGFLINIGQTYRQMGERQKALTAYRQYLDIQPETDKLRPQVEKMIEDLEREEQLAAEAAKAPPPAPKLEVQAPPPEPVHVPAPEPGPPPEDHPWYSRWWFWTGTAAVVAGAVVAGVTLSSGSSAPSSGSLGTLDGRK